MGNLNLLKYAEELQISKKEGKSFVKDIIRKKDIFLLPEELVRQCVIHFLISEIKISKNLMRVEKGIKVNGLFRRCDVIVYDRNALPLLIVECKSPSVKLDLKVFSQIAMYNIPLRVPYLMVTNGASNYFCKIDFQTENYEFLDFLPLYDEMLKKN